MTFFHQLADRTWYYQDGIKIIDWHFCNSGYGNRRFLEAPGRHEPIAIEIDEPWLGYRGIYVQRDEIEFGIAVACRLPQLQEVDKVID